MKAQALDGAAGAHPDSPARRLSICLINPRFEPSYWGFEYALPLYPGDKRSTMISGALPTLAALCGDHQVDLLDENVEDIDWESLRQYDLVGITGMNVQKTRFREILLRLRALRVFTAVGGPLVSVQKDVAEILIAGKRVKILTPNAVAAAAAGPAPPASGGLAAQAGAGNYVVDQRALNAALDNIGQAMTDARLLPSVKDGKVEGFRASEVKPQGIFGTIGIKNGDVLLRMNDFPIDSPEKAIQSFASLKGQSRIKLDLIRDGQPTTFNYDIR